MRSSNWLTISMATALLFSSVRIPAQSSFTSGIYEIISGTFIQRGGFVSEQDFPLPNQNQSFIQLTVNGTDGTIDLSILGSDLQPGFPRLTDGIATSNVIRFQYVLTNAVPDLPMPVPATVDYILTNSGDTVWLSGSITSSVTCCDFIYAMEHHSVQARQTTQAPLTIRASEVELCWSTQSNRTYQVQYRSEVTTNQWVNLGSVVPADGSRTCVTDKVIAGQPRRFYRVVTLPVP